MFRHIAFTFLVFVIFAGIASAQGNDMEGLRASFEREIAAFNARGSGGGTGAACCAGRFRLLNNSCPFME